MSGRFVRFALVLATSTALLFGGAGGANAATGVQQVQRETAATQDQASRAQIESAVESAFAGDAAALAALLEGPRAALTQVVLKDRLEERGDLRRAESLKITAEAVDPAPMSTGQYDYYCTGYNGVTIGWNGMEVLACHGWLDTYISGRHVAHYNPDLIPRGAPVTVGCAYAMIGVVVSLTVPLGVVGWAVFGTGVLYAGGGVVVSCG